MRSITRGICPARQSCELDLVRVHALGLGGGAISGQGPIGPGALFVVAAFFMFREIEASLLVRGDVEIRVGSKQVVIKVSVSKTDPMALSTTRTWGGASARGTRSSLAPTMRRSTRRRGC